MAAPRSTPPAKMKWIARFERRVHAWRERRARRRGRTPTVTAFPGYGSQRWVRVLGRVLIVSPLSRSGRGEYAGIRGWRSFGAVPIGYARVLVTIDGVSHEVVADRGGVIDTVLPARLAPGWREIEMSVEGGPATVTRVFVIGDDVRSGIVSDVDDTVMVTALPRPFLAAWNTFVLNEHARLPVPGMSVLLERVAAEHPGTPVIYLSTGAWNVTPTLVRFLRRHLFPEGSMLLTDWGPTHDRWFRSGKAHKRDNLERLAREFPLISWLLIGDDGQHDDEIYTRFASEHPTNVSAVAIRTLTSAEAVLAGGRTVVDHDPAESVPRVTGIDGAALLERLAERGVIGHS